MEQKNLNDLQTWDLSYRPRQEANLNSEREPEFLNYPVLDLSCKNPVSPITISTNTTACLSQSSPADMSKQHQHSSLSDAEKQSPFTSSTVTLLSSSEMNSLRKMTEKTEPSLYNAGGGINNSLQQLIPSSTVTMGVPILNPPHLPLQLSNQTIRIPVATSTITSTSTSYVGRTLSLQTNDETKKPLLKVMPEPSVQVEMSSPSLDMTKKTPRPFKAYTNSFSISRSREIVDPMLNYESERNYIQFRAKMLDSVKKMHNSASNPKMRRTIKSPGSPTSTADEKTQAYWDRRKKNNAAAKRSRDARRAKEDELAIWATFLQEENAMLKGQLTRSYYLLQQEGYDINQLMTYNLI